MPACKQSIPASNWRWYACLHTHGRIRHVQAAVHTHTHPISELAQSTLFKMEWWLVITWWFSATHDPCYCVPDFLLFDYLLLNQFVPGLLPAYSISLLWPQLANWPRFCLISCVWPWLASRPCLSSQLFTCVWPCFGLKITSLLLTCTNPSSSPSRYSLILFCIIILQVHDLHSCQNFPKFFRDTFLQKPSEGEVVC